MKRRLAVLTLTLATFISARPVGALAAVQNVDVSATDNFSVSASANVTEQEMADLGFNVIVSFPVEIDLSLNDYRVFTGTDKIFAYGMNNLDEHADEAMETDFDRLFQALGDAKLADRTYSWISAMLFSITFILLYLKGKERMEKEGLTEPELKVPVYCLIDECRNIGKIPNLSEYLATCRKYRLSIMPIFQNYSQIVELYAKEGANSIIGNCDTTIFLGGSDSDTLKIICEHLGKETVKTLSFGLSKGKMSSTSTNKQDAGRELMSRIQVEQMNNTECLVFIRSLRPFKVKMYRLDKHPNYRYTAEADSKNLRPTPYLLEYCDEGIEEVRVKAPGEEGYTIPAVVDSARKRALEVEKRKKVMAMAEA